MMFPVPGIESDIPVQPDDAHFRVVELPLEILMRQGPQQDDPSRVERVEKIDLSDGARCLEPGFGMATAARRRRPFSAASTAIRRGSWMVMDIFGNQRRRNLPLSREKGVYCAPSMRTGRIAASARSAIVPGPS